MLQIDLAHACRHGDYGALVVFHKNIINNNNIKCNFLHDNNEELFRLCYKNNHISSALLLYDISMQLRDPIDIHVLNEHPFKYACMNSNIDFAKWLVKTAHKNNNCIDINIDNDYPFRHCCQSNNLQFAKWLYEVSLFQHMPINIHIQNECCFTAVCRYGNLEFISWLYQIGIQSNKPFDLMHDNNLFLTMCCKSPNVWAFNWLFDKMNDHPIDNIKICIVNCFKTASINGNSTIIKMLLEKNEEPKFKSIISRELIDELFSLACLNGKIIVAKLLYANGSSNVDFVKIFYKCCKVGNKQIMMYLYEICKLKRLEISLNVAFYKCCKYGHIESALWLFENDVTRQINLHQNEDEIFWSSCKNKLSDVAKMIYDLCFTLGDPINLDPVIHDVFRHCCINDDIVCVKWLYDKASERGIEIDIRYNNDTIFKFCCCHEYVEVASFLAELCGDYSVTIDDDYAIVNWFIRESWYCCAPRILPHKMATILGFKIEKNDIAQTCTICKDDLIEICKLPCNHFYCSNCFVEWYLKRNMKLKCTYCQKIFEHTQCTIITNDTMLLNDNMQLTKRLKS